MTHFLLALILLASPVYAAETLDPACACHAGETDDERIARLETELRLARAARAVNAGIAKAARKRVSATDRPDAGRVRNNAVTEKEK